MDKVLIAEDDSISRLQLAKLIEQMGHAAIQASDGVRAWLTLSDNPDISLIITDMKMPGLGGEEFIQLVRMNQKFSNLPIIIISGIVSLNDIQDILKAGASRFLPKPVNMNELQEYVSLLIDEKK